MTAPKLLVAHSLKRVRTLAISLAGVFALFQILLIIIAGAFHGSRALARLPDLLPPFMREFFGPSLSAFISFGGMISQVYFHPMVIASFIALAITIGTLATAEIESGFIDLILSRPMARHWMITRSIIVAAICVVGVVITLMTASWVGLYTLAPRDTPWPPASQILSLGSNLCILMLAWCAIATAIGAGSRRRGVAGACAGFLALATFLLDYTARVWAPARSIAWLSPFHYYNALDLIAGAPVEPANLVILTGISIAGFGLAYFLFQRRDLAK
jgi:ABC-2 type transport system permease protein